MKRPKLFSSTCSNSDCPDHRVVETPNCPSCGGTVVKPTPGSPVVKCAACGRVWNPEAPS